MTKVFLRQWLRHTGVFWGGCFVMPGFVLFIQGLSVISLRSKSESCQVLLLLRMQLNSEIQAHGGGALRLGCLWKGLKLLLQFWLKSTPVCYSFGLVKGFRIFSFL